MKLVDRCIKKDNVELIFDMENKHEFGYAQLVYRYANHKIAVSLYECKYERYEGYFTTIVECDGRKHTYLLTNGIARYSKKAMKENVIDVDAGLIMELAGHTNLLVNVNEAIAMVEELRKAYGLIVKKFVC